MVIYAIKMLLQSRHCLQLYLKQASKQAASLLELSAATLKKADIKAIILDFDGVLNHYHAHTVAPAQYKWLQDCAASYGANNIFILSNKPSNSRKDYFAQHFPGINFIIAARKKPYPDGILAIQQQTGLPPQNLLMVDDRLLTGILAACITGIKACYITKPLINYYKHPVAETYFSLLRRLERLLV